MPPRARAGTDAKPTPGKQAGGRGGAKRRGENGAIDWLATLLQGRPRRREDLQRSPRSNAPTQLWLIVVDASASTRRHGALGKAKGLLAELFERAYRERARIAVLDAHGAQPQWHWQGQKASAALQQWLAELGAGGGSPLIPALQQAHGWLQRRQRLKPGEEQRLLVITDGRLREWPALPPSPCPATLVDIECAPIRLGRAVQLAGELGAEYRHIEELEALTQSLRHSV
ncbi:magnesium chelatase [Pseudomonas daroniae]|uniref:Magnesium chelatase n=1 Tax=Phytopseudomonas daroniae TaxID=2487519 RepID=A0A4Q9QNS9_9GAMM|nr:VWA domain-containing protein [Pseudomonas sp. FRB 228]TBU75395.1 magnesium chelatase [Pseudomonas daroniae]TBU81650.1 magnesium chelatase [Pseudomonas daroniae]TBU84186.1 magnesium chelatase [Pseudomonas sp. FRB 228]TBU88590.1 magnesium chelatase [Pseudomonas daroniae]